MANNYSPLGFWRSWHRSYNLWIVRLVALLSSSMFSHIRVRYIYIPLGGTKNSIWSTVLIFSFVALWHDLSFTLLTWGWLVSLFILPELAARYFVSPSKVSLPTRSSINSGLIAHIQYGSKPWYRHVCALGAIFNILMMMTANLIGFVMGTDGISYLLGRVLSGWEGKLILVCRAPHRLDIPVTGLSFMGFTSFCLFVGTQVMFEYRCGKLSKTHSRRTHDIL